MEALCCISTQTEKVLTVKTSCRKSVRDGNNQILIPVPLQNSAVKVLL